MLAISGMAIIGIAALAGCSGSGGAAASSSAASAPMASGPEAAVPSAAAANGAAVPQSGDQQSGAGAGAFSGGGQARSATSAKLIPASQQIIYTAQLTLRAKDVGAAIASATRIVTAAGGYVSSENATSDPDHPASATATIELKIPVTAYQQTLASLSGGGLGTQLSLRQQAQDVTQQVADVNSQVTSDMAAIAQLRELLKHAGSVGDLLNVQNQINQAEAQLEDMEAQQRALSHETAFATVTVTVLGPKAAPRPVKPARPPGLVQGLSGGWHAFKLILGAVAPFAAVLAVLAFAGFRLRRRAARPAAPPAPVSDPPAGT